tara:strand:+ start:454 stop:1509 length:1056 start_codon:yes stop_codon:yes gene_type:complete
MGINHLHKLLKKHSPDSYRCVKLKEYQFQKIAIDVSLYMYKYKCILGENWLNAFINLICCLRKNDIHGVFIFDSKAPPEKTQEQKDRREQRQKIKDKLNKIKEEYIEYQKTKKPSQFLIDMCKEENKITRLLSTQTFFKEDIIETKINKLELQTISIDKEDFNLVKELFKILGIPYYQATTEAEATGAYLCREGLVYGVMSDDTDVLAYGSPKFMTSVNTHSETCIELDLEDLLENLELSYEQFRDLCIMCGTDYNKNIPKIGPQKSYQLIKSIGNLDKIDEQTIHDTRILNYHRVRQLFTFPENYFTNTITFCKPPNFNKVQEFLFVNNCKVHIDYIQRCFSCLPLEFLD